MGARLVALVALVIVSVLQPAVAQVPGPTVTATASGASSGAIEASWTPVDGAVGYIVAPQRLRSTGEWAVVTGRTERFTAARPVVFDGLIDGASYRVCVAAVVADGFRTALSGTVVPYGLPDAPVITDVARAGTTLTVTWTAPAANGRPVTSYAVTLSPADVPEVTVGGNQTSVEIEGVSEQAAYTVTVRATNLRGQSTAAESGITNVSALSSAAAPAIAVAYVPVPSGAPDAEPPVVRVVDAGPCGGATSSGSDGTDSTTGTSRSSGSGATEQETASAGGTAAGARRAGSSATEEPADVAAPPADGPGPVRPAPSTTPGAPDPAAEEGTVQAAPPPDASSSSRRGLLIGGVLAAVVLAGVLAAPMVQQRRRVRAGG